MRMEARLILLYKDERSAQAVLKAISPDNAILPSNMTIEACSKNNQVVILIKYHGEKILTLQSTVDDLLSCISVAEKSITVLNKVRQIRYSKRGKSG